MKSKPLTDSQIAGAMESAIPLAPVSQAEIARRAGIAEPTASKYANKKGDDLSDKFKPLAFFIEIARSSPEAFNELRPILGQPRLDPEDLENEDLQTLTTWLREAQGTRKFYVIFETIRMMLGKDEETGETAGIATAAGGGGPGPRRGERLVGGS